MVSYTSVSFLIIHAWCRPWWQLGDETFFDPSLYIRSLIVMHEESTIEDSMHAICAQSYRTFCIALASSVARIDDVMCKRVNAIVEFY